MLPLFTPSESQHIDVAHRGSSPRNHSSYDRTEPYPATAKRDGQASKPGKKRVITSARREQNREAQRLYRQRQRELRDKKKELETQSNLSSTQRRLLPRSNEDAAPSRPGGSHVAGNLTAPDTSPDAHEDVPPSHGPHPSEPASSALILPSAPFSQAPSPHPSTDMSYWTSFWTSLAPQRTQVQPESPSRRARSSMWLDEVGSDIFTDINVIRDTPGPGRQPSQPQQQQGRRRRSLSPLGPHFGSFPSPYLNTLQFLPSTILSATLQNALALGFDMSKLGVCRRDYISPYYCPGATAADDLVELLRERMIIQPHDADQRDDYRHSSSSTSMQGRPVGGAGGPRLDRYLQQLQPSSGFEMIRFNALDNIPADLRPTVAQVLIPHHASLDLIPIPALRAQAILLAAHMPQSFDLLELKGDIYVRGGLVPWKSTNSSAIRGRGGVVGAGRCEPWLESSWEAKGWFLRKWSAAVGGEGANLWRQSQAWEILRQTLEI